MLTRHKQNGQAERVTRRDVTTRRVYIMYYDGAFMDLREYRLIKDMLGDNAMMLKIMKSLK